MKSLKVAKMNINGLLKSISIYYGIILAIIISSCILSTSVHMSGIEISTVIFLFVCGLNSFKINYYFAKANNISRKLFISGILISIIPITAVMTVIDMIINRISNIFLKNPTFYDMSFGNSKGVDLLTNEANWVQSNSIETLFYTFMFQLTMCIVAYVLGLVINMIYYRCNKIMKVIVSIVPIALIIISDLIFSNNSIVVKRFIDFTGYILGITTGNILAPITTFIIVSVILSLISVILIRNSIIKEK